MLSKFIGILLKGKFPLEPGMILEVEYLSSIAEDLDFIPNAIHICISNTIGYDPNDLYYL